jgi:hypothetical protein
VEAMKGKNEHVRSITDQSDPRIKYLEEELGESTKKVQSKLLFICEQTSLLWVIFWNFCIAAQYI